MSISRSFKLFYWTLPNVWTQNYYQRLIWPTPFRPLNYFVRIQRPQMLKNIADIMKDLKLQYPTTKPHVYLALRHSCTLNSIKWSEGRYYLSSHTTRFIKLRLCASRTETHGPLFRTLRAFLKMIALPNRALVDMPIDHARNNPSIFIHVELVSNYEWRSRVCTYIIR